MKIIDAHTHSDFHMKGYADYGREIGVEFTLEGMRKELAQNNVQFAVSIAADMYTPTPMSLKPLKKTAEADSRIVPVAGINPQKVSRRGVQLTEQALKTGLIKGLKVYLGYFYYYPISKIYHPFYRLAQRYDVPVIFHTGDTFGEVAILKYARPLHVDEAAVRFPKTRFVIAHIGNPWVVDAAEVIYKNDNVSADLSGLAVGKIEKTEQDMIRKNIKYAFDYVGDPEKFMYGSDWPLVRMKTYIDLIKKAVPAKHHKLVFHDNAERLFRLK